jgi:hypothetical protein
LVKLEIFIEIQCLMDNGLFTRPISERDFALS